MLTKQKQDLLKAKTFFNAKPDNQKFIAIEESRQSMTDLTCRNMEEDEDQNLFNKLTKVQQYLLQMQTRVQQPHKLSTMHTPKTKLTLPPSRKSQKVLLPSLSEMKPIDFISIEP